MSWTRAVLLTVSVGCGGGTSSSPVPEARTTERSPSLDLQGQPADPLASDAAATVLIFVSTHCPISNRYAPTIQRLSEAWAGRGVRTWLVYPDPDDEPEAIRRHLESFGLELPAVRDPKHGLVATSGVRVTPEAAVFTKGRDVPAYVGRIDDRVVEFGNIRASSTHDDLDLAVEAVLEGKRPSAAAAVAIGCYISDLR